MLTGGINCVTSQGESRVQESITFVVDFGKYIFGQYKHFKIALYAKCI